MQIVIDIPDNKYHAILNHAEEILDEFSLIEPRYLYSAVIKGTPKALEQKAAINEIRERISLEKLGYPPSAEYYKAIVKVLRIIDEYKAESEDKE